MNAATPPVSVPISPVLVSPAERLAAIIQGMYVVIARRGGVWRYSPSHLNGVGGIEGELIRLIWTRLCSFATRFAAGAARFALNPFPIPRRPRAPGTGGPHQPDPLPRQFGWLLRMIQETANGFWQLRYFLAEPDVAALLAEAPQLLRILRPLCHMLGIEPRHVPSLYAPTNPRPTKSRPIKLVQAAPPPVSPPGAPPAAPAISVAGDAAPPAAPAATTPRSDTPPPDTPSPDFSTLT